jgi:hypothetical protein
MDTATVRLVMDESVQSVIATYTLENHASLRVHKREYRIELKERNIPHLMNYLNENAIQFYEISIDKPNLEDFFLKIASQNKNRDL